MKNFLKKLHKGSNQSEGSQGTTLPSSSKVVIPTEIQVSSSMSEHKPFSGISGWLNSVTNKNNNTAPPSSSNAARGDRVETSDSTGSNSLDGAILDSGSNNSRDRGVEEEYQIQLALELSAKEDPEAVQIEAVKQISLGSSQPVNTPAEVVAYRYWNYNALSYDDKIPDGFYDLYGILTESTSPRMPSLADLQGTPVSNDTTWEAILVNREADTKLLHLEQTALEMAVGLRPNSVNFVTQSMVEKLASLVSDHMGGPVGDPDSILIAWRSLSHSLKRNHGSMVLPIGSLTVGLARHRALLFKVLSDSLGIPCRLVKGVQFTGSDDVAISFVKIDGAREYIVDLMGEPGTLIPPDAAGANIDHKDSLLSSTTAMPKDIIASSSRSGRSSHPYAHARSPSWTEGVSSPAVRRMKVKDVSEYMIDAAKENPQLAQKLHNVLLESGVAAPPNLFTEMYQDELDNNNLDRAFLPPLSHHHKHPQLERKEVTKSDPSSDCEVGPAKYKKNVPAAVAVAAAAAVVASSMVVAASKANSDPKLQLPVEAATATAAAVVVTTAAVTKQYEAALESAAHLFEAAVANVAVSSDGEIVSKSDVALDDVADCEIPWEDIALGERIGLGSYGEVYRGDWHGTEVAVKKFLDQDIIGESLEEFKSEVWIMKKVRHPNVVLFMGAVTRPPNLSIVTEFLPRGSLYRLLHRPNNQLDWRRRLRMALDAARGMNYLHNCSPVIVHRDLKSPNLLVDKNWVVKVCDFGLSRMKHSTFLSSRSTAGTAEWMAPEVLRNEPSNEKCDVYSFGVILWELCTMRQPWGGMNPMQVVGAVGFQHRRLDIPDDVDPAVADIIVKCWETDPSLRPSFGEIMDSLKPLQKPVTGPQVPRPRKVY